MGMLSRRNIQIHHAFPASTSPQRLSFHLHPASFSGSFICSLPLAQPCSCEKSPLHHTLPGLCATRVCASARARVPLARPVQVPPLTNRLAKEGYSHAPGADYVPPPCVQAQTSPQACQIILCCRLSGPLPRVDFSFWPSRLTWLAPGLSFLMCFKMGARLNVAKYSAWFSRRYGRNLHADVTALSSFF